LEKIHADKENPVELNFGRIIALAGDFYTNREGTSAGGQDGEYNPICGAFYRSQLTPMQRFHNAVDSLRKDSDGYLRDIWNLLGHEVNLVSQAQRSGQGVAHT